MAASRRGLVPEVDGQVQEAVEDIDGDSAGLGLELSAHRLDFRIHS